MAMTNRRTGRKKRWRPFSFSLPRSICTVASALPLLCSSLAAVDGTAAFSLDEASTMSSQQPQHQYPRPLHPGGFSLPPLVEDRLSIATSKTNPNSENISADGDGGEILRTDVLLVKPPDMESLWEWYAYTKRQTDGDPSWGRVWPTALSLSRFVLRSLNDEGGKNERTEEGGLMEGAANALRTASHVVEVGCGLGVAGLAYASSVSASSDEKDERRTITFLDREPYALHCVMASATTNGLATGPILPADDPPSQSAESDNAVTARAAIDDWTFPASDDTDDSKSPVKNVRYRDLHLSDLPNCVNPNTILLASDILYEPSSMPSLAAKLRGLLHPADGGYALIADPRRERTAGCREAFVKSVRESGGEVGMLPMPELESVGLGMRNERMLLESDVDIDGSLCKSMLIVVHFRGKA